MADFFANYGLLILLGLLLVFMFWSQRRRGQRMKAEQEAKARETVPGAEVLLQGGLYGTIVEFDPENLDAPAEVEIAPGTVIRVHSQAILRVVTPTESDDLDDAPAIESIDDPEIEAERDESALDTPETEPGENPKKNED